MDNIRMPKKMGNTEDKAAKPVYRIVLACEGVPADAAQQAASDITEEFTNRPWRRNALCTWDGHTLLLQAENDFDPDGLALMDEFPGAISAYIVKGFDGDIRVQSAEVRWSHKG